MENKVFECEAVNRPWEVKDVAVSLGNTNSHKFWITPKKKRLPVLSIRPLQIQNPVLHMAIRRHLFHRHVKKCTQCTVFFFFYVLLTVHYCNDQFWFQLMHHNFNLLTKCTVLLFFHELCYAYKQHLYNFSVTVLKNKCLIFIVPCIVIFYGITNRCHNVQWSFISLQVHSTCFGRHTRPSSGVQS